MAVRNISITARFYFTNLLLYFRTIFIGLIFLLFPMLISAIIAFFSSVAIIQIILTVIFLIIAVVLFIIVVHLNSTLEIFVLAIWYEAYQECKKDDILYEREKTGNDKH